MQSTVSGVVKLRAKLSRRGFGAAQMLTWCVSDDGQALTTGLGRSPNRGGDVSGTSASRGRGTSTHGQHSLVATVTDPVGRWRPVRRGRS
ncbi:MAG: hypothetical protein HIU57_09365 [Acidobacteria bacterium]|nr:hypothetical protein [Acidobacteriota bacterium]